VEISVIIPVHNEEQSIARLLENLSRQTLRPSEIVIADAGSTDRTAAIIATTEQTMPSIHLIRAGVAFPGRARNLAAAQANNEWLAFIDAGVNPEPDWLESLARRAQLRDVDVVYGSYEPVVDTLFKQCAVMAYVAPPVEIDGRLIRSRSVASVLMKRKVWQAVGGFPENLRSAEDLLFMDKVDAADFRVTHASGALVHWQVQGTPWLTFKRFVTYARNNMRAGLWRQWQSPILQRYAFLLAAALPAFWFGVKWLIVPLFLWVLMLAGRAAVMLWRNRVCYPAGLFRNVVRLLVLVPLIALIDAATISGTLQWALKDKAGL
jgi:glycosyltransferase involved in cell wall biosynthesis